VVSTLIYDEQFTSELRATVKSLRELLDQTKKYGFNLNLGLGRKP